MMRDKLVKLIKKNPYANTPYSLADHLIANGVIIAEDTNVLTNAGRIRAMSDEELARFVATKIVNLESHKMAEQGHTPTATQLSVLGETMYCTLMNWLQQPAEVSGDA